MTENTKDAIKAQADQLESVNTALTNFNATEAGLIRLHELYDDATFDVDTSKGMKLAREARAEIRKPRFNVEKLRKAAKAPILELGRMIDADAKSLTQELLALETPIDNQIKVAERREAKRLQDIDERLREFQGAVDVMNRYQPGSEKLEGMINDVICIDVNAERFEEFEDEANDKKNTAIETMRAQLAITVKAEKDAAELAELRREKAERDEADRKEAARKQAVADAAQAALDEGQGKGSKSDAGSIFDEASDVTPEMFNKTPPPIEEQLMRKPEQTIVEAVIEAVTPAVTYPGRAGIVYAVALHFEVSESVANEWIEKIIEQDALPF